MIELFSTTVKNISRTTTNCSSNFIQCQNSVKPKWAQKVLKMPKIKRIHWKCMVLLHLFLSVYLWCHLAMLSTTAEPKCVVIPMRTLYASLLMYVPTRIIYGPKLWTYVGWYLTSSLLTYFILKAYASLLLNC